MPFSDLLGEITSAFAVPGAGLAPMQNLQGTPGGPGTPPQGGMPMPPPGMMGGGTTMGPSLISQQQGGPNGAPPFAAQNSVYNQPQVRPGTFPPQAPPPGAVSQPTPQGVPTPPPGGGDGGPITQDTMRSALGINPTSNDQGRSFEASLAGGLKGINGPGKFASFARGLGGGLQGGLNQDQQNLKNNMTVQQQWHNDMSNDFKNTQTLRQTDANVLWRQNQGAYFQARAANQDPNNPARIIAKIDSQVGPMTDVIRRNLQAQHPGEAIDQKDIDAGVKAWQIQQYQSQGLDPNQVQNVKERGMVVNKAFSDVPNGGWYLSDGKPIQKTGKEKTDPASKVDSIPSPFEQKNMTDPQFHANVPVGSWVIPRGGTVPKYRREGPPPDWRGAQSALNGPNLDDQAAVYAANQP
jgi:hypothetical protein